MVTWMKRAQMRARKKILVKSMQRVGRAVRGSMRSSYVGGIHRFKQTVTKGVINNTITVPQGFAFEFKLSDLNQSATFAALFDQYRIAKIVIKILPRAESVNTFGNAFGLPAGVFYSVIDYDDANAPTTVEEIQEYDRCRIHCIVGDKIDTVTLAPRIAVATFGGGAFTSYMNERAKWIDVASTGVSHYGWKGVFPASNATFSRTFDIVCDYYLEFKNAR